MEVPDGDKLDPLWQNLDWYEFRVDPVIDGGANLSGRWASCFSWDGKEQKSLRRFVP
jgi:hypothetical protein